MKRRRYRRKKNNGPSLSYINKERKFHIGNVYDIIAWIFVVIASVILGVVVIYLFGIRTIVVGSSMEPSLKNGQEVLINRVAYQFLAPANGDVIAFHPNGNVNAHLSVKRVVGVPGDTILIENGKVYLNGYIYSGDVSDDTKDAGVASEQMTLGADEYFVLGDNRSASEDSRSANIGNVSRGMIEGKVWLHLKSDVDSIGLVK